MHKGMQYDPIQGQGQRHEFPQSWKSGHTDHGFLNLGKISKFDRARFFMW